MNNLEHENIKLTLERIKAEVQLDAFRHEVLEYAAALQGKAVDYYNAGQLELSIEVNEIAGKLIQMMITSSGLD